MAEIIVKMVDHDRCIICDRYIGKGNDPALCDDEWCHGAYNFECSFNRFASEEMEKLEVK